MIYEEKYQELVELSHSDTSEIRKQADAWLVSIGLQDAAELKVSAFLLDLAIRNVKGEIIREEVSRRLNEHYADIQKRESKSGLDGGYEIIPPDSSKIKEIEEYNRNSDRPCMQNLIRRGITISAGTEIQISITAESLKAVFSPQKR